jgi:hypothetical protein
VRDEKKTIAKARLGLDLCERIFVTASFSFFSEAKTLSIQMNLTADLKTRRPEAQTLS